MSVDAILAQGTISQRRKKLEELAGGKGLSAAYTATLSRMQAQRGHNFSNKVLAQRIQSSDTDLTQVDLYIADIQD